MRPVRTGLLGLLALIVFVGGAVWIRGGWSWPAVRDGLGGFVMCLCMGLWGLWEPLSKLGRKGK